MAAPRPSHRTIAHYCVATHLGGAERSLLDLVTRLSELSAGWYRPWMILPSDEGLLVDALREREIDYSVLPIPSGVFSMSRARPVRSLIAGAFAWRSVRSYLSKLDQMIGARAPDLIHTTGIKCHAMSARLNSDVPVLWHLRDILDQGTMLSVLRRIRQNSAVQWMANSYATALAFEPENDRPNVVMNGIDTDRFVPGDSPVFRERFGVQKGVPIIGIVGVLARGKGVSDFIQMAARLHGQGIDARFVVVGDELYDTKRDHGLREELEAETAALGISDVLHFVGYQENIVEAIQGLDMLVSASTHPESFGRVLVEAMACGVPVVASALGGVLETMDDSISGRLFAPGDVQAMGDAVVSLLEDEKLRVDCVTEGLRRAADRFRLDLYVTGVIRAYDRIFLRR